VALVGRVAATMNSYRCTERSAVILEIELQTVASDAFESRSGRSPCELATAARFLYGSRCRHLEIISALKDI
jgi:hypothetical protein